MERSYGIAQSPTQPAARGIRFSLELDPGSHTIVLDLARFMNPWRMEARVLEKATLAPPAGARFRLPGAGPDAAAGLAGDLADVTVLAGAGPDGYQPSVRVAFPRGAVDDPSIHVFADLSSKGSPLSPPFDLGKVPVAASDVLSVEAALPKIAIPSFNAVNTPILDEVGVRIGTGKQSRKLDLYADVPGQLARGMAMRSRIATLPGLSDRDAVIASLDESLAEVVTASDRDDGSASPATARLRTLLDQLDAGKDPLHEPGVLALARRSPVDGAPQPFCLHVPAGYARGTKRRYPLVVVLHGYRGNPGRVMAAFLGTESTRPHPGVDGFVLAPNAHGDSFYRGPGETEVLDLLDWVLATYPIDPDRVSITGISMGGTGASHFALRYPDRFAAAAALAGYHSYFVRRDIRGRRLRAWERHELTRWSPASWAENGHDLFLYVAQGTHDLPLEHSTSLTERYKALGYELVEKWPDIGHDVWRIVWGDALLWPTLSARRIATAPAHVFLKTDSLTYGRSRWVRITGLSRWDTDADIDARILHSNHIAVTTHGVSAFELLRPPNRIAVSGEVSVKVDGTPLTFGPDAPVAAHKDGSTWATGLVPPADHAVKRAGLEGPIRDAYAGPLAFVYGTLDPRQTEAAREVAEHFKARWAGDAQFPVLPDTAVTDDLVATHSLFLVGSRDSNRLVRDMDPLLPLAIDAEGVRAGNSHLHGDAGLGFACIYPNPRKSIAIRRSRGRRERARALPLVGASEPASRLHRLRLGLGSGRRPAGAGRRSVDRCRLFRRRLSSPRAVPRSTVECRGPGRSGEGGGGSRLGTP